MVKEERMGGLEILETIKEGHENGMWEEPVQRKKTEFLLAKI